MDWNSQLKIKEGFITRDLGDEVVLMTGDGQEIHSFEDIALLIWNMIGDGLVPEDMVKTILKEYEVDEEVLRNDLAIFFQDMTDKDILEAF